jgi:hypothetical protein
MRKGGWIAMDDFSDASREHYGGDEPDGRPSDLFIDVAAAYCLRAWAGQPEVAESGDRTGVCRLSSATSAALRCTPGSRPSTC